MLNADDSWCGTANLTPQKRKIETRCPHCQRTYRVPEQQIGHSAKCACGQVFTLAPAAALPPRVAPEPAPPVETESLSSAIVPERPSVPFDKSTPFDEAEFQKLMRQVTEAREEMDWLDGRCSMGKDPLRFVINQAFNRGRFEEDVKRIESAPPSQRMTLANQLLAEYRDGIDRLKSGRRFARLETMKLVAIGVGLILVILVAGGVLAAAKSGQVPWQLGVLAALILIILRIIFS